MKIDKKINLKGEVCPYTFVKSKLAIEDMQEEEVLEIIVDHLPAVENVPRSLEEEGHKILKVERINSTDYRIVVEKGGKDVLF
jgi:TusA-related sulfurtransferase